MALGAVGLVTTASSASATPTVITETFGGSGPTGPLELQLTEAIDQPASVTQGNNITISVPGGSQLVPTTQSVATVNFISNLHTIIRVPAQSTFVAGSIVAGDWSFTDTSNVTTTGPLTVTECTTATTIAGVCDAVLTPSSTFLGPTATTTGTSLPYLEASTGSAQFAAGGSLTLPTWSFDVTATGTGSIVSTVSEFDTNANISIPSLGVVGSNVGVVGYPAAVEANCLPTAPAGSVCPQAPYQYQPIATTVINSPPAAPVLQPQTGSVSAGPGQCTTINPLNGAVETGTGDTINPASVTVVGGPNTTNGTTSVNTTTGVITYCNNGGTTLAADTFQVTAADTLASPPLVSAPVTETINISYNSCSAGSGNVTGGSVGSLGTCSLNQAIILPVTAGQIVLTQGSGLPLDFLGSSICTGGAVPGITLNGDVQAACGAVSPLTITNATGLDSGWTLTGQVTDFNDPAAPSLTCDIVANYSNHCIPGGNLAWEPAAAVASSIVPGDTAQVAPGGIILPFTPVGPSVSLNPILQGSSVQPNPVVEPAPNAGLQSAPQTMCSTASGQSGGTFICAAGLELLIPASVAEPAAGPFGPAFEATLTVTLS